VTPQTGVVYVSEAETLMKLQQSNITISLFVVYVNSTTSGDDDDDDDGWQTVSTSSSRSMPRANISVYVQRAETVYNLTTLADKRRVPPHCGTRFCLLLLSD